MPQANRLQLLQRRHPMFKSVKTVLLSLAIGVGAIAGASTAAQAGTGLYNHSNQGDVMQIDHRGHHRPPHWRPQHWRPSHHRPPMDWRRCTPQRAAWKADRLGLNRVRVLAVTPRTITVQGRRYGDRHRIVFGRAAHCPVIARF
jgi:hypothetical protein